jgi:hypothetical protein
MPALPQTKIKGIFLFVLRLVFTVIVLRPFLIFAQTPPDADLYYRRTHDGQWPPTGVNPSDHSGETPNTILASTNLRPVKVGPKMFLDNGIDPANLGKGDWIWEMPATVSHLDLAAGDVQGVIDYEKNLGMQWITVKCGDGGNIWSQFDSDLVARAHAAGLKIFGWAYAYGNNAGHYGSGSSQSANINGEINVALNALALGADGFIIDAEIEYETNSTRAADATLYAGTIKSNYPARFLAHAPFPYINSHSGFPYIQFGIQCDAVMPQDYWGAIGISPQTMVVNMNTQWRNWQNGLTGNNTNAIKPIVPLAQSYAPVTGAQITAFLYALQTNSPKASATGYNGVSFWDAQERTADMDAAVLAATFDTNAPTVFILPIVQRIADAGGSANFTSVVSGTPPLTFQWQLNGANIFGANTNFLSLTNLQPTHSGNYSLIVSNAFGSVASSPALLIVYPVQTAIFSDNFDFDSATNWTINKSSSDASVNFYFDYSSLGIPIAPHSADDDAPRGLQMKANLTLGAVAALSASPFGLNISGDYRLHFDAWINVNGPFPGGGASSTEFLTAGIGTAGNVVEWTGNPAADGFYFSADGDGGVSGTSTTSGDYCAYVGSTLQATGTGIYLAGTDTSARDNANAYYTAIFPNGSAAPALQRSTYPQQTGNLNSGTFGFAWHDVIISRRGSTVDWSVDGVLIADISNATFTANNVFVGFWDPFASLTDNTNLSFGLVDNVRVEVPAIAPLLTLQTGATFKLIGSGQTGANYILESSTNLTDWTTVTSLTATNGAFEFDFVPLNEDAQRFLRARVGP